MRKSGAAAIAAAVVLWGGGAEAFTLSDRCPPSVMKTEDGRCRLVSVYQVYQHTPGHGGLRKALPAARDGDTPEQIDLGRLLFFDPILSVDHTTACAHCHAPEKSFTDGLARARGRHGEELARNTPPLWNLAFSERFFWDARAESLEQQAESPLLSPRELGHSPASLVADLEATEAYARLFAQAFDGARPSMELVARALAAFQATLVSLSSRYDRFAHGDATALTEAEIRGHNLFRSFVTRCSQCHTPPLFTNNQLAVIGAPEPEGKSFDPGAEGATGDPAFRGAFRVPTLRNIALTAPYVHSGSLATLRDVVEFYNAPRGHALPADEPLTLHWHIALRERTLSDAEVGDLVAFLGALTDTSLTPATPTAVPSGLPVLADRDAPIPNRDRRVSPIPDKGEPLRRERQ